jgi:NADH-quinone oxidoreductase subunit A
MAAAAYTEAPVTRARLTSDSVPNMYFQFANVLVFLFVGMGFVGLVLYIGRFLRPHNPEAIKNTTYECGEKPIGSGWINYNARFFMVALVFLIFEVEIALIFPVAKVFSRWVAEKRGFLALVEILIFVLILLVGLIYAWAKDKADGRRGERSVG